MAKHLALFVKTAFFVLFSLNVDCRTNASFLEDGEIKNVKTENKSVYPETLLYDPDSKSFYVGSVRFGSVYRIDEEGNYQQLIQDQSLHSVLGIEVDFKRDRLLVTNSDLGVAVGSPFDGNLKVAGLGIYRLSTGERIAYVNLAELTHSKGNFANGIALDEDGNAYITDSIAPVIYKVDTNNVGSVFLSSPEFNGDGFNLNGIQYHPDGYLIAIKKSTGSLYKIPLDEPKEFSKISIGEQFIGGDGLIYIDTDELVVIANETGTTSSNAAYLLKGTNNWNKAKLVESISLGDVYPTTGTVKDRKIHVIHSNLKVLRGSAEKEREALGLIPIIREIGHIREN